ncbi:N-acetylmuramoyl-L-alanine amidase [Nocardioides sp. AE5]|uniref:N-acetylmuramoyl-L-alanine amidase n=1 Tax=Nocardioides sp. AE5 TaxID=2962573 RepID=UPI0028816E4B|nr:N-acetylmuramoyl-L-alanine amidase [Nocardioides sp. AE5]MDT0202660.1 N-acetylmuramoyl-L-alanine amidase [Nocardioides sp. AE5]
MLRWAVAVASVIAVLLGGALLLPERAATPGPAPAAESSAAPSPSAPPPSSSAPALPLEGRTVIVDPGHQLGNGRHPARINAAVPDGAGGMKACNTTGTSTNDGYPEATFTWEVALLVRDALEELGAEVVLTRLTNSVEEWGPCVDERGEAGNDLAGGDDGTVIKVSIHADGSGPGGTGFHVISSPVSATSADASAELATVMADALAESFPRADYIAGGDGLDVRRDLATLNHARVPTVMVELGNMRNAEEAARMRSSEGQAAYAEALVAGIRAFLES